MHHPITKVAAFATLAACALAGGAAAQVVTSAGGEVVSPAQKNLVDRLIVSDSFEVATAKLAATKTQNPAVRDFANMLASEHTAHIQALEKIAAKKEVGREAAAGDSSTADLAKAYATLQGMPAGAEFDKAFVQAVIDQHKSAIASLESAKSAAQDEELKKDLDATATALQTHLSHANEVEAALGSGTAAPGAKPPVAKPPR